MNRVFFIFGLCLTLVSCNRNIVFTEYKEINNQEWFAKNPVQFEVQIEDNINFHNISLKIRHADSYPYSNLFLFVSTSYPDGKTLIDTMEVILANNKGEWMGNGTGDIFDYKIPIKKNVRFPQTGKYLFSFQQAMRTDPLPLIMDVGFEVEKSN
ncbi:MAG: gliding motility lipoprotein GldH [Bacteroidia bacterium]